MKPILILLDEFPLLGKIEVIMNSLTTLRSKNVHFYLAIQSISQLDYLYGKNGRAIIVDNCQYKILLNITEPDSQAYFSRMIGKVPSVQFGTSYSSLDESREATLAMQQQETRENLIWPEEFATNRDIWLHTPHGFFSTIKLPVSDVRRSESEIIMKLEQYRKENYYYWRIRNGT